MYCTYHFHCHHHHHSIQLFWHHDILWSCSSLLLAVVLHFDTALLFLRWSLMIISSSSWSAAIWCTLTDRNSSTWFCWKGAGVASTVDITQEVSLSPTDWTESLQGGEEVFRILARGPALRPLVGDSEGLLELVWDCLTFFFFGTVMPGIFLPQQSTQSQCFWPSLPNTQKKRKMKKPCSELNMAKRNWKAVEASRTVRAPNIHVSPKRAITPTMLVMSLKTLCWFTWSLLANFFRRLFWISTLMTVKNTTALRSKMAKMGPRKAPKNTPGSPMKQLEKEWVHIIKIALLLCGWHFLLSYCAPCVHISITAGVIGGNSCVESGWWKCDHEVTVNCQWNGHWNNWCHCSEDSHAQN